MARLHMMLLHVTYPHMVLLHTQQEPLNILPMLPAHFPILNTQLVVQPAHMPALVYLDEHLIVPSLSFLNQCMALALHTHASTQLLIVALYQQAMDILLECNGLPNALKSY